MVSQEGSVEQLSEIAERNFTVEVAQIDAAVAPEVAEDVARTDREKSSGYFDFNNLYG